MNIVENTIWEILIGNIRLNDKVIRIMVNSPPTEDLTPCLTLNSTGTGDKAERYIDNIWLPVTETHPLYNPSQPFVKYPFEATFQKKGIKCTINIWADNEDERIELQKQTLNTLHESINYNYKHCLQYQPTTQQCKTLNTICKAINNPTSRGQKGQCPKPSRYNYKNIITNSYIIPHTISIGTPFNLDDYNKNPIQLHTVIEMEMDYYETHILGGTSTYGYSVEDKTLKIKGGNIR